jgi:hypothetical protein
MVGFSRNANPCLIVLTITPSQEMYLMHAQGEFFWNAEMSLIKQARTGIAGGGSAFINKYADSLKKGNILPFAASNENDTFNLAVVRQPINDKQFGIPRGIYYGFSDSVPNE